MSANNSGKQQGDGREVATRPQQRQSPISAAAAGFAQNILDLEQRLEYETRRANQFEQEAQRAADFERRAITAETELVKLREDIGRTATKLDFYQQRCVRIETKLGIAGNVILDALKEDHYSESEEDKYKPKHAPGAVRAVQAALTNMGASEDDKRALPNFVTRRERQPAERADLE